MGEGHVRCGTDELLRVQQTFPGLFSKKKRTEKMLLDGVFRKKKHAGEDLLGEFFFHFTEVFSFLLWGIWAFEGIFLAILVWVKSGTWLSRG